MSRMPETFHVVTVEMDVAGFFEKKKAEIQAAIKKEVSGATVTFKKALHLGDKMSVANVVHPDDPRTGLVIAADLNDRFLPILERRLRAKRKLS